MKKFLFASLIFVMGILFVGNGVGLSDEKAKYEPQFYFEWGLGMATGLNNLLPNTGVKNATALSLECGAKIDSNTYFTMRPSFYISDIKEVIASLDFGVGGFLHRSIYMNLGVGVINSDNNKDAGKWYYLGNVAFRIFADKANDSLDSLFHENSLWLELGFKNNTFYLSLLVRFSLFD